MRRTMIPETSIAFSPDKRVLKVCSYNLPQTEYIIYDVFRLLQDMKSPTNSRNGNIHHLTRKYGLRRGENTRKNLVGVYVFHEIIDRINVPVYVGKSTDILKRISEHLRGGKVHQYFKNKPRHLTNIRYLVFYEEYGKANVISSTLTANNITIAYEKELIKITEPALNIIYNK